MLNHIMLEVALAVRLEFLFLYFFGQCKLGLQIHLKITVGWEELYFFFAINQRLQD